MQSLTADGLRPDALSHNESCGNAPKRKDVGFWGKMKLSGWISLCIANIQGTYNLGRHIAEPVGRNVNVAATPEKIEV